ncbi:hypothetical protein [Haliangium sp. UPWRP_2]|uniref:hypothetical protein n=1 Tax=Haliangium sp. UPWRP_2 TaxID=1931276 RepID=UPI001E2D286B|nr:hypothetical protein [Haliangium sp. UPWRP_2]
MSSVKGRLVRLLGGGSLRRGTVTMVQDLGGFRRLVVQCDVGSFVAGTKVQLLLPSDDMRTYTPIPDAAGLSLLGWKHAGGPGARWLSSVQVGEELSFLGPQRSLELDAGPVLLVGDETSVAVAAAFASARPGQVQAVIATEAAADVEGAAAAVGLRDIDIVRRGDVSATVAAVGRGLSRWPAATVALTGESTLIVGVREALRRASVKSVKTKTYWVPGKMGLD